MYRVMIRNGAECATFPVDGAEAAWEAYKKACDFCEFVGGCCDLVVWDTLEVLECFGYDPDPDDDY